MASYNPKGKDLPEWKSQMKGPSATPQSPYGPTSTGSSSTFARPWPGDQGVGAFKRVADTFQSNLNSFLLYGAATNRMTKPDAEEGGGEQAAQEVVADQDPVAPSLGDPFPAEDRSPRGADRRGPKYQQTSLF